MKKCTIIAILFMLFTILCAGCVSIHTDFAPENFPRELLLNKNDLPDHFSRTGGHGIKNDLGAGYTIGVAFTSGIDNQSISFLHDIALYSDEESANIGFSQWEQKIFPSKVWQPNDQVLFTPPNPEDEYRLGCVDFSINEKRIIECVFLQQHANIISYLSGDIDEETITFDLFNEVLTALDNRLQQYSATQ